MESYYTLPEDFDGDEYFSQSFGIITSGKAEIIKLKVLKEENKHLYFESLPLHASQKKIEDKEDYVIFQYYMQPTYDLRQEILSHGYNVEVLAPQSFRDEIAEVVREQAKQYK